MNGKPFLDPAYLPILKKYEAMISLQVPGEGNQTMTVQWLSDAKGAITRVRESGLGCPPFSSPQVGDATPSL